MTNFSDYIYDVCLNSINAQAKNLVITIQFCQKLMVKIKDDGIGMTEDILNQVKNFEYTSNKMRKVGLGLSLINDLTRQTNGSFDIQSIYQKQTTLSLSFDHKHIDFPTFGNLGSVLTELFIYEQLNQVCMIIKNKNRTCMYTLNHKWLTRLDYQTKLKIEDELNQKLKLIGDLYEDNKRIRST